MKPFAEQTFHDPSSSLRNAGRRGSTGERTFKIHGIWNINEANATPIRMIIG